MKLKSFCTTKEIVSKLMRLPTEREKIFASYASEYTGSSKNSPKFSDPMKK
jgi:hypothetical protein